VYVQAQIVTVESALYSYRNHHTGLSAIAGLSWCFVF